MAFGHDKPQQPAAKSIAELRQQMENKSSPAQKERNTPWGGKADRYARMLMTSYNIFRPLVIAAVFDRGDENDDVIFDMDGSPDKRKDQTSDAVRRVSIYWTRTIELIRHLREVYSEAGVDLGAKENRWMFRVLWRQAADMVANAAINGRDVDMDKLKALASTSAILSTGKDISGINDQSLQDDLKEKSQKALMEEVFGDDPETYTLDRVSSIQIAQLDAEQRLLKDVDKFAFYQGPKNGPEAIAIVNKLLEITYDSATWLFRTTSGVDANGESNDNYKRDINETTKQQMLMRCVSDSAALVSNAYNYYAKQARKSILRCTDADERYEQQLKVHHDGVPYQQIAFDVKQTRYALNNSARPAVRVFAQLLDESVQQSMTNNRARENTAQTEKKSSDEHKPSDKEQPQP